MNRRDFLKLFGTLPFLGLVKYIPSELETMEYTGSLMDAFDSDEGSIVVRYTVWNEPLTREQIIKLSDI
jgi:hypothetical protein